MSSPKIEDFLKKHDINFVNIDVYERAITHTTFANEHKEYESYEMLELLGDAVLQLKSTVTIFKHFKKISVGQATGIRSKNVDNDALAKISKSIGLNNYLICSNNREELISKTKICADIFEALIGAIYLDLGDAGVDKFLGKYLFPKIKLTNLSNLKDSKTSFQELIQLKSKSDISYNSTQLPDKTFKVDLVNEGKCYGTGFGKTKKIAENNAAKEALEKYQNH